MPSGELVTETLAYDGGRKVTAFVPRHAPEAVVFAGDGALIAPWGADLESTDLPPTMVVGVHRHADETLRLHEYSPGFDPDLFAAHERFVVSDVRRWVRERFDVALPADRTAVLGVSAGAELALALGLRHPELFGAVVSASPGAGFRPPDRLPERVPRTYLVAGDQEPFFLDNARRWAAALRGGGAEVVLRERPGEHGGPFWRAELPLAMGWVLGEPGP